MNLFVFCCKLLFYLRLALVIIVSVLFVNVNILFTEKLSSICEMEMF